MMWLPHPRCGGYMKPDFIGDKGRNKGTFKGFKELSRTIENLTDPKNRKAVFMRSGKLAMQPILRDAIALAPKLSPENIKKNPNITAGTLKNDIKYRGTFNHDVKFKRTGKIKSTSKHEYIGQVKTGKASEDYAIPIEYGKSEYTVVRIHVFGRKVDPYEATMSAQKATPFMRKALDQNAERSVKTFLRSSSRQLLEMMKKEERKARKLANKK